MKTILAKYQIEQLIQSGYEGPVLVPVMDSLDSIEGEVSATLSANDKAIRTTKQNASIHKYCSLLAGAFEDAGLDMQTVLDKAVPVKWTMEAVKEVIWRRIQIAMFPEKTSTTQLETKDVNEIYQVIARHMSNEFNINQSFPNRFGD